MSARCLAATVLLVVAGAAPARADSPADRDTCTDANDVVGERTCPHYGTWGDNLLSPYVFVGIELNMRQLAVASASRSASPSVAARTESPVSPALETRAMTYDARVGVGLPLGLFLAVDFELGNFALHPLKATDPDLVLGSLLSAGAMYRLGPISVGGEIAGGILAYSWENTPDLHKEGVVEARARGALWLSPWCTIGGVYGKSLLDPNQWMAGVELGIHTHSYARR
jgi:hypothetical protein